MSDSLRDDPHAGQPVGTAGVPLPEAEIAVIMVHGRGATAESILTLAPALAAPGVAFLAPQAGGSQGNQWYPYSFMAPIERNEPGISSGMRAIARVLGQVGAAGIRPAQTLLLGFSQGACLAAEFVARHAQRYGGLAVLSGALIGPDDTPRNYPGSLDTTSIFLGCSDVDSHIPAARVRESAEVLGRLGGEVTLRLYPGMGHMVNEDEIEAVRGMIVRAGRAHAT
jgi:phospholipase/carboxylesterase